MIKKCLVCGEKIKKDRRSYELECRNTVALPNGKAYSHFIFFPEDYEFRIYYLPFKIIGNYKETLIYYQKKKAGTKPGSPQFKKVLTLPTKSLQCKDGPALIRKLKTLLLFI